MEGYFRSYVAEVREQLFEKYIFGESSTIDLILIAYFARGHVLIEGPPGTGKTLLAKMVAHLLGRSFKRIQFTSDMLPADIIGAHIYSPQSQSFSFIKGPLFSDIILADEINRTPPRTQSALLEAMEEKQVTVEGELLPLSPDFFVIATQNPQDFDGTFPLPEAQIDRFLFKICVTHETPEVEAKLLEQIVQGVLPPKLESIASLAADRARIDQEMQSVRVEPSVLTYISQLLAATRDDPTVSLGSSVRGGVALVNSGRLYALLQGRQYIVPDDIKALVLPALRHRITLNPEAQVANVDSVQVLERILEKVAFPS